MNFTNDKKRIIVNSIFSTSATLLENVIFFLINLILANYLTKGCFNEFVTALGYATFFSVFVEIGINQTLVRIINLEPLKEKEHIANAIFIKTVLAIAVYLIMFFSVYMNNKFNDNTLVLVIILGFSGIISSYIMVFYAIFEAKERFVASSLFKSLLTLLMLISIVVIVLYGGTHIQIAIVRLSVVVGISLIMIFVILNKYGFTFNYKTLVPFIKSGIPFGLTTIFKGSFIKMGIVILSMVYGDMYSGEFNNGFIFITAIFIIPGNFNRVLIPYLFKIPYESNKEKFEYIFHIYSKFFLLISYLIFINLFLFSKDIIPFFFSKKYMQSIDVLIITSFAIPFLITISETIIMVLDKQRINMYNQGIAFVTHIITNIILIKLFQAKGAALATVFSFFVIYCLSHFYLIKNGYIKYWPIFLDQVKIIGITIAIILIYFLFLHSLFFIIAALIISCLYLVCVGLLVVNRKDVILIKTIFKK